MSRTYSEGICFMTISPKPAPREGFADVMDDESATLNPLDGSGEENWCRSRDLNPDTLAGARP